ncbi:MAG TPA: sensor histidine kinase [Xanthobacteraceae bacterium]|nr:sensor histidine kinase [Xanthobacteraceae bacterium]
MVRQAMDWWRAIWGLGLRPNSPAALVFALGCVVVATLVRIGLGWVSPDSAVFAPYYSATLVAALVGGVGAGAAAALAGSIVALWLFVPPDWTIVPFVKEQVVSVLLYGISCVVIIWAAESYRGLLCRLRDQEAIRQLLNHELDHRIKNILASVQAIVNQSLRGQADVRKTLGARIAALAATNDLLVKSDWCGASLGEILTREFSPYGLTRFRLAGEDVECPAAIVIPLALVMHELATNASKYGALSRPEGRVDVAWQVEGDRLVLQWVERGGPAPQPPTRSGFGTTLLRRSLRPFDGVVETRFEPDGLRLRLAVTLPRAAPDVPAAPAREAPRVARVIPSPSASHDLREAPR